MSDSQDKLKSLLRELFQLDNADLDFGIYRIMNAKRVEIERFLDNDLLPQVKTAFEQYQSNDSVGVKAELEKTIQQAKDMGVPDAEMLPKVRELRAKLAGAVDVSALEHQVFSDLYNFFRRYYSEGDFLSLRRYKEGVYAIPYEGEEVKLHWANHDQYYIKSSEYLRDYSFTVTGGKRVHFKLSEADTEKDNNKSTTGNDRRFALATENPISLEQGELIVRFTYHPDAEKRKQKDLNTAASKAVLSSGVAETFIAALSMPAATEADPTRTVLDRHLSDYTARNTFDYFIHKNLGAFLTRELDFYIKNEVMHLDDIDTSSFPKVEQVLSRIRIIRQIANKIIAFLAQLEDFQKKMWLKKKFVVDSHWLVTTHRVAASLRDTVADNRRQWQQWESLGFKPSDTGSPLSSRPMWGTRAYLDAYQSLVVDTSLFDADFQEKLLASVEVLGGNAALDDATTGVLVQSENFQALLFIAEVYRERIQCIYIDPPYNTDASAIMYKNGYKNSSWISLTESRVVSSARLLSHTGICCVSIDDVQVAELTLTLAAVFPKRLGTAAVRVNPQSRKAVGTLSPVHEYLLFYGNSADSLPGSLVLTEKRQDRYPLEDANGRYSWMNFIRTGTADLRSDRPKMYFPIYVDPADNIRVPEMTWADDIGAYVVTDTLRPGEVEVFPVVERDGVRVEKRWHRGFERVAAEPQEFRVRRTSSGLISIDFKTRIDEDSTPTTWWDRKEYASANYGAAQLKDLFGVKPFDFPKAVALVEDALRAGNLENCDTALDYFGGSGTTAHAVINLNREDKGDRHFVLVEMGEHFHTVLKPRVAKVIYSPDWKDGKAQSHEKGQASLVKVLRLESYEDTLNNLRLVRSAGQQSFLEGNPKVAEEYTLNYLLDVETKGSPSLLSVDAFSNPFDYTLNIATGTVGETKPTKVDLVETFNWLLGLRVKTIDTIKGVRVVTGTSPEGEKVLILWRNVRAMPSSELDKWLFSQSINPRDMEFDVIYVNGDNNLENLKKDEETWKVRLIEEDFTRLMFDVQDV